MRSSISRRPAPALLSCGIFKLGGRFLDPRLWSAILIEIPRVAGFGCRRRADDGGTSRQDRALPAASLAAARPMPARRPPPKGVVRACCRPGPAETFPARPRRGSAQRCDGSVWDDADVGPEAMSARCRDYGTKKGPNVLVSVSMFSQ